MRDKIRKITAAVILGLLLVTVGAETDTAVFCLAAENGSDTAEQAETVTKAGLEPAPDTEGEKIAGPKLCAQSAVLMDASTGRILYGKEETIKRPMASTTKIMTCILALEQGNPEDMVEISSYAASMPDVQLNIRAGEKYRLQMYRHMFRDSQRPGRYTKSRRRTTLNNGGRFGENYALLRGTVSKKQGIS